MRASLYLVGFAAASIVVAGIVEIGCSSSSTSPPPTTSAEASTDDGGSDAAACVPVPGNLMAATIDGGTVWSCFQSMCNTKVLTACSGECACNDAVLGALQCIATDAGTQMGCFVNALSALPAGDPNEAALAGCLTSAALPCAGIVIDGGLDAATTPADAASDAAVVTDAATDGGTADASDGAPAP